MDDRLNREVSPTQVAECLGGIDFPCSKDEIVDFAQQHNCPVDALDVLRHVPEKRYYSMADVMSGVGDLEP